MRGGGSSAPPAPHTRVIVLPVLAGPDHPAAAVGAVLLWPGSDVTWDGVLEAVLAEDEVPLVLIPDSVPGRRLLSGATPDPAGRVRGITPAPSLAGAVREALHAGGGDVVVIGHPCRLPAGWLGPLRRAAYRDDTVAAASPLQRGADAGTGAEYGIVIEGDALAGTASLPAAHPRIGWLSPCCAYLRRSALQLLGVPDLASPDVVTVLDDLASRALAVGLTCALADDVCVDALPAPDPVPAHSTDGLAAIAQHELAGADAGPLRHAILAARARADRLSVTIDARGLGSGYGGTQTYTGALIRALAESEGVRIRVVVGEEPVARGLRAALAEPSVEIITYEQAVAGVARSDVVHRPQQAFSADDMSLLAFLGERLVLTHLDLIAYRSPGYHASLDGWRRHRRISRLALGMADRVIFLSEHARQDAIGEELVTAGRSPVVGIGVDGPPALEPPRRPAELTLEGPMLVMIGADYGHKNRPFAVRLLAELHRRGWRGHLVLAGAHVPHGSSAEAERRELGRAPELNGHVVDLGPIDEPEKRWLLSAASALLCPSTYEGFGLTPLEAISAGLPCAYPNLTSLGELFGADEARIVAWDAAASADRLLPLLGPGPERDRHLQALEPVVQRFRWQAVVPALLAAYDAAVSSPFRTATARGWEELQREQYLAGLDASLRELQDRVSFAMTLADREGPLTRTQQQGLMRVAARRWLRAPVLAPFGALGRLGPRSRADRS